MLLMMFWGDGLMNLSGLIEIEAALIDVLKVNTTIILPNASRRLGVRERVKWRREAREERASATSGTGRLVLLSGVTESITAFPFMF